MKRKAIIILLSIMALSFNLTGCTDEKEALNKSMIVTDDVKADMEPELKVISTETIYLDQAIQGSSYVFIEQEDGSTLVRYLNSAGILEDKILVKVDGNKATSVYIDSSNDEYTNINKTFYLKDSSDNKVLLTDWYSNNKFEVDKEVVSNENSRYVVSEDYLIELVNFTAMNNFSNDNVDWMNLINNSTGTFKMPEDLETILECSVVGDRLFLAAVSTSGYERLKEELAYPNMGGYDFPDTLLVIDLTTNKLIEKATIGKFINFYPIDDERIIFRLDKENQDVVEMYNLNNKTTEELMKYSWGLPEYLRELPEYEGSAEVEAITFNGLNLFPSRDKIYYYEDDGEKIILKIAEINGMNIENVITAYEFEKNVFSIYIKDISISNDERELKIFIRSESEEDQVIDKIVKVKLNK